MEIEILADSASVARKAAAIIVDEAWEAVARRILWVVIGSEKVQTVDRLLDDDRSIRAGRVRSDGAIFLAGCAAAPLHRLHKEGMICA